MYDPFIISVAPARGSKRCVRYDADQNFNGRKNRKRKEWENRKKGETFENVIYLQTFWYKISFFFKHPPPLTSVLSTPLGLVLCK